MKLFNFDILFSTVTVFVIMFLFPFLFKFEVFDPFSLALADFRITDVYFSKILPDHAKETDIVVVNTATLTNNGLKDLSNRKLAMAIDKINSLSPTTIGIERILKRSNDEIGDMALAQVLQNSQNLVLNCEFKDWDKNKKEFKELIFPDTMFSSNASFGFSNFLKDRDKKYSTVREIIPRMKYKDKEFKAFSVVVASKYNKESVNRFLKTSEESETINFIGNHDKYDIVNAEDIIFGQFDSTIFRNKIVLMASFDTNGKSDNFAHIYYTPLNARTAGRTFPDMYSIFIHSNAVSMLLTDEYFDVMPLWMSILSAFLICYINMAVFQYISENNEKWFEISGLLFFLIESLGICFATIIAFQKNKYELSLTVPIVASALSVFIFELYYDTVKPLTLKFLHIFFPSINVELEH